MCDIEGVGDIGCLHFALFGYAQKGRGACLLYIQRGNSGLDYTMVCARKSCVRNLHAFIFPGSPI